MSRTHGAIVTVPQPIQPYSAYFGEILECQFAVGLDIQFIWNNEEALHECYSQIFEKLEHESFCIEAYVYSFETFEWVNINRCLIDLGIGIRDPLSFKTNLESTSFFDKYGKL